MSGAHPLTMTSDVFHIRESSGRLLTEHIYMTIKIGEKTHWRMLNSKSGIWKKKSKQIDIVNAFVLSGLSNFFFPDSFAVIVLMDHVGPPKMYDCEK